MEYTMEKSMAEEIPAATELSLSDDSDDFPENRLTKKLEEILDDAHPDDEDDDPRLPTQLPRFRPSSANSLDNFVGAVIGPTNLMELVSCPCCQQDLNELPRQKTLNEPEPVTKQQESLFDGEEEDDEDEEEDALPGVLASGLQYHPKRILVEGWLHKKGTGNDWLASRGWKARWTRLVLAKVDGYDIETPLLLIYWYPSSVQASTVIVLDSTVVLAVDLEDKKRWNSHRFEIRHATTRENTTLPVTRTFSAPKQGRDAWVYAISQALLMHEKQKAKARKSQPSVCDSSFRPISPSSMDHRPTSPSTTFDEVWTGNGFVTVETRVPTSPPSSPPPVRPRQMMSPSSPGLPRPQATFNFRRPIPRGISRQTSG